MFSVEMDDAQAKAWLGQLPDAIMRRVRAGVSKETLELEALVKTKLSGQVLNVRTGALRRSIFSEIADHGEIVQGKVASAGDVKYARIHEYGGTIPPHEITARNAAALCFTIGGRQVFAKSVMHPGSKMPERSFLRSSLSDRAEAIRETLMNAVAEGGRPGA